MNDGDRSAALRNLADGLQKQIDDKRRPMTQGPTPKRMREYHSRLHDAANLERTQHALRAIADYPPTLRYGPAHLMRESIASVAVRLRNWTPLDARIARRFRYCQTTGMY